MLNDSACSEFLGHNFVAKNFPEVYFEPIEVGLEHISVLMEFSLIFIKFLIIFYLLLIQVLI